MKHLLLQLALIKKNKVAALMANLAEMLSTRDNNFNFIRMVAALFVLVSHAYPLSRGASEVEPLVRQLGFSLGGLGVFTFFCISGFFISLSYDRSKSKVDFVVARFLRLFPALLVVLVLSAFFVGPLFTTMGLHDYFSSSDVYSYVTTNLKLKNIQFQLPGLFQDNPYPGINGSLWTLYYEVLLYALVLALGVVGLLKTLARTSIFFIAYFLFYFAFRFFLEGELIQPGFQTRMWVQWSFAFVVGMLFYSYRFNIRLDYRFLGACWLVVFLLYRSPVFVEFFVGAWCYSVFWVAFNTQWLARQYNRLGDYSYGLYIYAFPTQEILAYLWKGISPVAMILVALPVALIPAILSWRFIEHPCILRKKVISERISQSFARRSKKSLKT
ncbi:acyltransferase [Pseudomonas sp. W4I3]|uniref:acyltransferase family protein n=1 Tax=Pseudomonas sp. W4I3 TaxID=3042294 RepID=UPI0027804CE4|nr:acyltransferase [Pseudomonas sp. W4I3]MDQ0739336.1 peptidoglycan/LPS O-acetylase OafA/YrhL [Pseudomonas sp. W4I3]